MKARFVACAVLVLIAAYAVAAPPADLKPDSPAAKVDGKPITVGDLQRECLARFGGGTLGQIVDAMIVEQEATKRKITVTELEITNRASQTQAAIEAQKAQTGMGFQDWSAMRRISLREMLQQARMEILLEKMVEGNVKITDDDVSKYYQANRDKFRMPERMLISHIAVEKQEDADRIRQDIAQGKITFADAARKYSIDPYSQQNGGVWGWIVRGEDPIQKAAFDLKKDGDMAPVVKGKKGFEIVRRDGYQSESTPPFEEMQPKIKDLLRRDQIGRLAQQMMADLRRTANVETLLDFNGLNDDVRRLLEAAKAQQPATPPATGGATAPAPGATK
jgi:foldase protein PrsA